MYFLLNCLHEINKVREVSFLGKKVGLILPIASIAVLVLFNYGGIDRVVSIN